MTPQYGYQQQQNFAQPGYQQQNFAQPGYQRMQASPGFSLSNEWISQIPDTGENIRPNLDPREVGSGPAAINLMNAMFGSGGGRPIGDWSGLGSIFGGGQNPFAGASEAYNTLINTGGIVGAPGELANARWAANRAFLDSPVGDTSFDEWFGVGQGIEQGGGPAQSLLERAMGPASQFGWRDSSGNPLSTVNSAPMQAFLSQQNAARQNPDLGMGAARDAAEETLATMEDRGSIDTDELDSVMRQHRDRVEGAATAGDAANTANALVGAIGGSGAAGQVGGLANILANETANLSNRFESDLYSGIDTEAQRSLAMQMPELQSQMQLAGLGRSGANQFGQGQLARDVLNQANRDKQRTMAQFAETGRGLQAQALGQGAQMLGTTYNQDAARLAQALGQGAQGVFGAQQGDAGRIGQASGLGAQALANALGQNAQSRAQAIMGGQQMLGQQFGLANQRYLGDQQANANMLLGLEDARTRALMGQGQMQGQGFDQLMGMFGLMRGDDQQRIDNMLRYGMQARQYEQDAMNARLAAQMMPLNLMMTLATGTTSGGFQQPAQSGNPWTSALAQAGGSLMGNVLGGGGASYSPWS